MEEETRQTSVLEQCEAANGLPAMSLDYGLFSR